MQNKYLALIIFILIISFVSLSSVYIVDQRESAIVLQFGEPIRVNKEPGMKFKIPFIQNVIYFDNRVLNINAKTREVIASDQKRLIVDAFAKYKIINPLLFYQTVRNERIANDRLNTILDSSLRQVLGGIPFDELLSARRTGAMDDIQEIFNKESQSLGIDVIDVRIRRVDLPTENSEAIYRQMQTERETEAKEFRAEGIEEGQRIRASADKEVRVLLAESKKKAEIMRGEGDAIATKIYANAFNRDSKFFEFYRTMQAYKDSFSKDDTTFILSPDSEFLKFFKNK